MNEPSAAREEEITRAVSGARPSDRSLLRRFREGSQEAASELYRRYADRLRALVRAQCSADLARCVDAEDIVQSVFGTFFQGASRGCYDVPDQEELWKLFLVLALNKIRARVAYYRAAKRDVRLLRRGDLLDETLEDAKQDQEAAHSFLRLVIADSLRELPPQHKEMVELRIEGYEVAEIAALTGRSNRTVERYLQSSRQKLSALLQESC